MVFHAVPQEWNRHQQLFKFCPCIFSDHPWQNVPSTLASKAPSTFVSLASFEKFFMEQVKEQSFRVFLPCFLSQQPQAIALSWALKLRKRLKNNVSYPISSDTWWSSFQNNQTSKSSNRKCVLWSSQKWNSLYIVTLSKHSSKCETEWKLRCSTVSSL